MQKLETPATVFEAESQGLENQTSAILTQTKQDNTVKRETPIGVGASISNQLSVQGEGDLDV